MRNAKLTAVVLLTATVMTIAIVIVGSSFETTTKQPTGQAIYVVRHTGNWLPAGLPAISSLRRDNALVRYAKPKLEATQAALASRN